LQSNHLKQLSFGDVVKQLSIYVQRAYKTTHIDARFQPGNDTHIGRKKKILISLHILAVAVNIRSMPQNIFQHDDDEKSAEFHDNF